MRFTVVILSQDVPSDVLGDLRKQTFRGFEIYLANKDGIVAAMNDALENAKGQILVRIDDDVRLSNTWLHELDKSFTDYRIAGVTGPTLVPVARRGYRDSIRIMDRPSWIVRWLFDYQQHAPAKICNCGSVSYGSNFMEHLKDENYEIDHLEGTNWAMRTLLIKKVGGFDPKFDGVSEWYDSDVVFKIKKLGYRIKYNRQAVVWHVLGKSDHYDERFRGYGRIKNWLRFHWRHSKFHYKKVLFLMWLLGYFFINNCKRLRK